MLGQVVQGRVALEVGGEPGEHAREPGVDRFALGVGAATLLGSLPAAQIGASWHRQPIIPPAPLHQLDTDVFVAGVGTGGAVAALAAATQGAAVTCADPLPVPGGIGTLGGIHSYYYGIPGGLQEDIDRDTRALMRRYGQVLSAHPLNPIAKAFVLEDRFEQAHVRFLRNAVLFHAGRDGGHVTHVDLATPAGPLRVTARAFIDGTGDGDLCAAADARFQLGRASDGRLHAHSQVSYGTDRQPNRVVVFARNFDAGWCDPTDVFDLTRARLEGVAQHQIGRATAAHRVSHLAPAIGLRQGRQIVTDYVLTLDDQLTGRPLPDTIAYAGANQDTHFVDFPLASDESLFWLQLCRGWFTPFAHPIAYRMLLPRGLANVGIASRCLGVDEDAHHATRMMRDMQRIGEAIGYAAALLARRRRGDLRDVPLDDLQALLRASGALVETADELRSPWARPLLERALTPAAGPPDLDAALAQLRAGEAGVHLWHLLRHRGQVQQPVLAVLQSADNAEARWLATGIAAMWGLPVAEAGLVATIDAAVRGVAQPPTPTPGRTLEETLRRTMPRWLTAVALLRRCGTDACLDTLEALAASHRPTVLTALALLTTLDRLLAAERLTRLDQVERLLAQVNCNALADAAHLPQDLLGVAADAALRGSTPVAPAPPTWPSCNTRQPAAASLVALHARVLRALASTSNMPAPRAALPRASAALLRS